MAIQHYYGDIVRQFFVVLAIMIAICIPLGGNLQLGVFFGIPAVITLILLAGLTNPQGSTVMVADAIASGTGLFLAESVAISAFANQAYIPFAILECTSVLFLIPLYYSIKTVRAMFMHKIGRMDYGNEFEEANVKDLQ